MDKLFLSKLSPETMVWVDDSYFSLREADELIEEINKHPEKYIKKDVWLYELEDMPKPDMHDYVEGIAEQMDENCEDWRDKNTECLEELEEEMKKVFDKWRDKIDHKVYARNTEVIIDILKSNPPKTKE